MSKPNFQHDCNECKFLGTINNNLENVDCYYCETSITGSTLIARFSGNGPDYSSMPVNMLRELIHSQHKVNPILLKAYQLYCNINS